MLEYILDTEVLDLDPNIVKVTDLTDYEGNRSDYYLKLFAFYKHSNGDQKVETPLNDPNTVDVWDVEVTNDGWYQFFVVAATLYDSLATYTKGNVVFENDVFYKYVNEADGNGDLTEEEFWEEFIEYDPEVTDQGEGNAFVLIDTKECLYLAQEKYVCENKCGCELDCNGIVMLQSALQASFNLYFNLNDKIKAQLLIESAIELCKSSGCGCC